MAEGNRLDPQDGIMDKKEKQNPKIRQSDLKRIGLPLILFLLTFFSLTFRELLFVGWFPFRPNAFSDMFASEWPYSVSLILILLAHEMGHYLPAMLYGIRTSLPYFIPFPFSVIGTMGAVIQIQGQITDKQKLFDIGSGGPLASLILSAIAWVVGLGFSELIPITENIDLSGYLFFGDSLFTKGTSYLVFGFYDPSAYDIQIHPLARAGWVGLLVTAINLLPFGQLDGGHIIYSIFGEKYRIWIHYLFLSFVLIAMLSITWLIWAILIYLFLKIEHPYVPDPPKELTLMRKIIGLFLLLSLPIIFVPEPLSMGDSYREPNLIQFLWNYLYANK